MHRLFLIGFIVLALVLSGCNFFAPEPAQRTLEAAHAARGTEIINLRQTATAAADRLLITVEWAQTAVRSVDQQSTRIAATLMANGTPFIDARAITPAFSTPEPFMPVPPQSGDAVIVAPVIIGEGSAQGNAPLLTLPPTPELVTNTSDPNAPQLVDIVTASGVDTDDCPVGVTNQFSTDAQGVYVSAVARNLSPANVVRSRWFRDGVEVIFYDWSPGFNITEGCIWFYMPASDVAFSAGSWSVQLELDGQAIGSPVAFVVQSPAGDSAEGM